MKKVAGSGFVIDKTRISDNKLIIKVLDNSDQHFSAILRRSKLIKATPNFLDSIHFVINHNPKSKLAYFSEISILPSFTSSRSQEEKLDFFYFIADVVRTIGNRVEIEAGLFDLIRKYHQELFNDLKPDLLISFLFDLLDVFGILPTPIKNAKYLDFREGSFVFALPRHTDFCEAELIVSSPCFTNEISDKSIVWNSTSRYDLLCQLIRYFEFQKGISFPLKSIEVLRDLR